MSNGKFSKLENFKPFDKLAISEMWLQEVKITEPTGGKKEFWEFMFKNDGGMFSVRQYFTEEGTPNSYTSAFLKQVHDALGNGKETVMQCLDRVEGNKNAKCFIVGKLDSWKKPDGTDGTSIKLGYIGKTKPDAGIIERFANEFNTKNAPTTATQSTPSLTEPLDEDDTQPF